MKNKKLCAKCLHFYCCNLSQITKQCPVTHTPVKPASQPFDYEFGTLRQKMAEELARQPKPYIPWDSLEGRYE